MNDLLASDGELIEDLAVEALVDAKTGRALLIGSAIVLYRAEFTEELADRDKLASGLMGGMEEKVRITGGTVYVATVANLHFVLVFVGDRISIYLRGLDKDLLLEVAEDFVSAELP